MLCLHTIAFGHHAMDYIEMESYSTPKQWEFLVHLHYDFMSDQRLNPDYDHWELTPGFSVGLHDRLMFDIHTHFAQFSQMNLDPSKQASYTNGTSPFIEAIAASLQFRITDYKQLPIDIAATISVEVPMPDAMNLLGSEFGYGASLIFGWNWGLHNNITVNLTYEGEGLHSHSFGWAVGTKFVLSLDDAHAPCIGLEVMGDFAGAVALMPGFYLSINSSTTLKTGLLIGLNGYDNALRYNITLMRKW